MHILYITDGFSRPGEAGGARPWIQAVFMSQCDHQLTIITSKRNYYTDKVLPQAQGKLIYPSREEGMDILSVAVTPGAQRSMLHRVFYYLSFAFMVFYAGLRVRRVDLVYARTPALLTPIAGWLLARLKKVPLVIAIGDLHPEEAVALGLIRNPLLIRLWETIENFFRKRADLLVVTVPGIKRLLVAKGFREDFIHLSTNAYDPPEERQDPLPSQTAKALEGLKGCFIVMYAGSIGPAHALEAALEAARELQDDYPEIQFVIIGQGRKLPYLKELTNKWHLQNIHFFDPVPRSCMTTLLDKTQAVMHLVYPGEVHGCYYLPNKFFEYLGSGKPIIYSGNGEIAHHIKEAQCGLVSPPADSQSFAEAIKYLWAHQQEGREMGQRGRSYVMKHFDRKKILGDLVRKLEDLKGKPSYQQ